MNPPWLLLRGLLRDARHWGDFPGRLGAAFPDTRVLTLDLPGNGIRFREATPATIPAMVARLRADLAAMGVSGPVRLLALSLGGMIAAEWARRHPDEIARAVLVNTSLRPFAAPWERLRPGVWPALLRLLAGRPDPFEVEARILALTSARHGADAALAARWADWRRVCPVTRANALRQLWAAARYRAPRQAPSAPVTVVVGDADALVDPVCSWRLATAWGVPLIEIAQAGHDLPLDAPEALIEALREGAASGRAQVRRASV